MYFGTNKGDAPLGEVAVGVGVREGVGVEVGTMLEVISVTGLTERLVPLVASIALYLFARFSLASSCTSSLYFSRLLLLSSLI